MSGKKKKSKEKENLDITPATKISSWKRFTRVFLRIFKHKRVFKLGIYGPPNAGKTSIANRICMDWLGEEMGSVSSIPHETREITMKERLVLKRNGKQLMINLVDTPGIATKIDYEDFMKYGLKAKDAKRRAREATKGVIDAIKWLDSMDIVLAVMDSSKDPYTQVNITILGNLEARKIPVLIIANKIDLRKNGPEKIKTAFPQYPIVGVSAKKGTNFDELYDTIFKVVK